MADFDKIDYGDFDKIDYGFKFVSIDEFELVVKLRAEGRVLDMILNQSKKALGKKLGVNVDDLKADKDFSIPSDDRYFNVIRTALSKPLKLIRREIVAKGKLDGRSINLLNERVVSANFVRVADYWLVVIVLRGTYNE